MPARSALAVALIAAALGAAGCASSTHGTSHTETGASNSNPRTGAGQPPPVSLQYRPLYSLASPVQDPAIAAVGASQFVLLGGISAAETSTAAVVVGSTTSAHQVATLPNAQHDAQAAALAAKVYLFGGGQFSQYDHLLAFDPANHSITAVGTLPAPASDVAVTASPTTAYVVGGFNGSHSLDTVVAWPVGGPAHIAGRLPVALRYSAAADVGGAVIVAGGSTPGGDASRQIYRFDPSSGRVSVLGQLPQPVTHGAAAVLDGMVYLVGGRGSSLDSQSPDVWAINPSTGQVRMAGRLAQPLSDAAVTALGDAILVAGGRSTSGTQAAVGELVPAQ